MVDDWLQLVNPRLSWLFTQIPFGTHGIFRNDTVNPFHLDRATDLEGFIWKGFAVNRQGNLWMCSQRFGFARVQTRAKHEDFASPMEPDGQHPRRPVTSDIGEPCGNG